jgi:hypothetical protein
MKILKLICRIFGHSWYVKSDYLVTMWTRQKISKCGTCGIEKVDKPRFAPESYNEM